MRRLTARPTMQQGSHCGTHFEPSVQGVQHEMSPLQGLTLWYTLPPLCAGRPTGGVTATRVQTVVHASSPVCRASNMMRRRDRGDVPLHTWKQTARSLLLAVLSERGVTPTTADQITFDVFVISLQDAPAWREQKRFEKAEGASQKEEPVNAQALGPGPSSLERRKHTLASYLMGPNAVGRQPRTGTWRPTSGPAPQRRCKAPGGTCYAPVLQNCSKGMYTPHCLSFQIACAQRFVTCTGCKYKRSGVRHRHTQRATDSTELKPWIGDWQGHLDEPRWRHVAQNKEDENQDSDTSSVIDENPLAQPQTFSARARQTLDLPPDDAEEETLEAYRGRLLGSAPQRNSLPRRPGDTPSEDADFAEARTANLLDHLQQPPPAERRPSAVGTLWKPRRGTITALCAIACC